MVSRFFSSFLASLFLGLGSLLPLQASEVIWTQNIFNEELPFKNPGIAQIILQSQAKAENTYDFTLAYFQIWRILFKENRLKAIQIFLRIS